MLDLPKLVNGLEILGEEINGGLTVSVDLLYVAVDIYGHKPIPFYDLVCQGCIYASAAVVESSDRNG
jgi:hypothetical protein